MTAAVALLVMSVVALTGEPAATLTRDLLAQSLELGADLPFYAGAMSMLTGWTWASAIALAVTGAILVPARRRWLLSLAAMVLVMCIDDAFLLHELVGPAHGIPEKAFYAVYAVGGTLLLLQAWRHWRQRNVLVFLLGGCALAFSIGFDVLVQRGFPVVPDVQYLVEDGAKLLGAILWLAVPFEVLLGLRPAPEPVTQSGPRPVPASRSRTHARPPVAVALGQRLARHH